MNVKYLYILLLMTCPLNAQNHMDVMLSSIEKNNTTLKALRETANAQKLGNQTDIGLPDPEIEFNYLWGSPTRIGNRKDIAITQSFDFLTLSNSKKRMASKLNDLIDCQYKAERQKVLLEAWQYALDLVYYNALCRELEIQKANSKEIVVLQKKKLEQGDGTALEYNNMGLNQSLIEGKLLQMQTERQTVLAHLKQLNGGLPVVMADTTYDAVEIPENFNTWFNSVAGKSPLLDYVRKDVDLAHERVSFNKKKSLPSLSLGYMSEKTIGEHFQGVSIGISIPLWSNKNRVKQAKAEVCAAENRKDDAVRKFYGELEVAFQRVVGLQKAMEVYRKGLQECNNSRLLKKSLDMGQISILEYLVGIGTYYETLDKVLASERDFQKAYSELISVTL